MRAYLTLLRLPYQLQLGPIFGWGYLLAGGRFNSAAEVRHVLLIFLLFHVGAFGGLTALNSYYDKDEGPIGGLWQPPRPPRYLLSFAWAVQIAGLLPLLWLDWNLAIIYAAIVLLSLGYSHPRTRWKGRPLLSVCVVALGQGVLDYTAGVYTAPHHAWHLSTFYGLIGSTLLVIAFYPLSQLYQLQDDLARGDRTLAQHLSQRFGRRGLLLLVAIVMLIGVGLNALALGVAEHVTEAMVLFAANLAPLFLLLRWSRDAADKRGDFLRAHYTLRSISLAFGCYVLLRLYGGGL